MPVENRVVIVTSMPTSVTAPPARSTICAASGSLAKLASTIGAAGPRIPGWKIVDPMSTILRRSLAISGAFVSASATLVKGPTAQSAISPGFSFAIRMIRSQACSPVALIFGDGEL